jgi:hypothetical protein
MYPSKLIWRFLPAPTCHAYVALPTSLPLSNVSSESPKYLSRPISNHLWLTAQATGRNLCLNILSSSGVNVVTVISSSRQGKCWSSFYSITTYMFILPRPRTLTKGVIRSRKRSPTLTVKFCRLPGFAVSISTYDLTHYEWLTDSQTLRNW